MRFLAQAIIALFLCPSLGIAATPVAPVKKPAHEVINMEEDEGDGMFATTVLPDVNTRIRLSSSDVNRFVCPNEIKDVVFSQEKGVNVKISGKNAFIKFRVKKAGDKMIYATTPSELFVVCGDSVYNMISIPSRIPAQVIRLSSGKAERVRKNISALSGLPFEKKVLRFVKDVYTENIPDSYTVKRPQKPVEIFRDLKLSLERTVEIEGEGLTIKEYLARAVTKDLKLSEKSFLRPEITLNPVAVSIDKPNLKTGDETRIFIVEMKPERMRVTESDAVATAPSDSDEEDDAIPNGAPAVDKARSSAGPKPSAPNPTQQTMSGLGKNAASESGVSSNEEE